MGSTGRKIHNDCVKMTEDKMKTTLHSKKIKKRKDDDLEQSSSSANALRNASIYWKHSKQQQQQYSGFRASRWLTSKDQEIRDGFSTKMKLLCTNFFVPKKIWDVNQVRLLRCGILPTSSSGVVASPGSPGRSSPPGFLFFSVWCCSESEDSAI